jgi:hypothetical protein
MACRKPCCLNRVPESSVYATIWCVDLMVDVQLVTSESGMGHLCLKQVIDE